MTTWRVARGLDVLLEQYDDAYPGRSTVADGSIGDAAHAARVSDHNPNDDGVVCARDFTNDPEHGFVSDDQARHLAATRDPRIKYVISNGRIFSRESGVWAWRPYTGTNGHFHHFHISVLWPAGDGTAPWDTLDTKDGFDMADLDDLRTVVREEVAETQKVATETVRTLRLMSPLLTSVATRLVQVQQATGAADAADVARDQALAADLDAQVASLTALIEGTHPTVAG